MSSGWKSSIYYDCPTLAFNGKWELVVLFVYLCYPTNIWRSKILSLLLGYNNQSISVAMEWWEISNLEPIAVNGNIQNGELNEEIKIKREMGTETMVNHIPLRWTEYRIKNNLVIFYWNPIKQIYSTCFVLTPPARVTFWNVKKIKELKLDIFRQTYTKYIVDSTNTDHRLRNNTMSLKIYHWQLTFQCQLCLIV